MSKIILKDYTFKELFFKFENFKNLNLIFINLLKTINFT